MAQIEAAGTPLSYSTTRRKWLIRITAVGTSGQAGTYSWQAIAPLAGTANGFTDLTGWAGTIGQDALFEDNGNPGIPVGTRIPVSRDYHTGQVRAQFDSCSSS
jgi:hypothetical protein